MMTTLNCLSDNSDISVIDIATVVLCFCGFFSFSLRFSRCLTWWMVFCWNLDTGYYVTRIWILFKPFDLAGFLGQCSGRGREVLPCYCQVGVKVQVSHSASINAWIKMGGLLLAAGQGWEFWLPNRPPWLGGVGVPHECFLSDLHRQWGWRVVSYHCVANSC